MQAFRRVIEAMVQALKGLGPSSKLLIGSLCVILVMALLIVALYTGRSSMTPLPVSLTGDPRTLWCAA